MPKYINADDCEKYFYEHLNDCAMAGAMNAVNEMPAADVVEVETLKKNIEANLDEARKLRDEYISELIRAFQQGRMFGHECDLEMIKKEGNRMIDAMEEKVVKAGEKLNFENLSKSPVTVGTAVMFNEDGVYICDVLNGKVRITCGDQTKAKHGEWIKGKEIAREKLANRNTYIDYDNFTCSNCGIVLKGMLYHIDGSSFYKFCPNCGADMRNEENEN